MKVINFSEVSTNTTNSYPQNVSEANYCIYIYNYNDLIFIKYFLWLVIGKMV